MSTEKEKQLQIVSVSSPFQLPDDWLVEERPRPSNPAQVDRYYYEPKTRRKFRSLLAVQRHLTEETIISENKDPTYMESATRQRFPSARAFEGRAIPKFVVKSGTGKRSARGVKSCQNPGKKCFSAGTNKITLKASIKSTHYENTDFKKKIDFEDDERGSNHNLSSPPAKVSWVLSGPGGLWSPFLDDSVVPESEKLKWSEAFVQSIHGVMNGQWT